MASVSVKDIALILHLIQNQFKVNDLVLPLPLNFKPKKKQDIKISNNQGL